MGVWSFTRDAGAPLGVGAAGVDDARSRSELRKEVARLGLAARGVEISVAGDRVRVTGISPSQEIREKIVLAVGNVAGVAEVDDAIRPARPAVAAFFHTVEPGDTLWAVAAKAYGDGAKYLRIFEANKPMLAHPDGIYPGQVLRVPQD